MKYISNKSIQFNLFTPENLKSSSSLKIIRYNHSLIKKSVSKMGFGKAFLLSIAAFVGLNFIFTIINFALVVDGFDTLFDDIQQAPLMILYYLFGSIVSAPFLIFNVTIVQPFLGTFVLETFLFWLGYLIAPIIAAILAGRFGESKIQCFGGWALTAIISTVSVIIAALLSDITQGTLLNLPTLALADLPALAGFDELLIFAITSCIINVFFYGFFTLLVSKIEYY